MPFRESRCEQFLQGLRPAGPGTSGGSPLRQAELQHAREPLLPLPGPFLSRDLAPLPVGDPLPAVVAQLLQGPARHVEKHQEGPRRGRKIRLDVVGDLTDHLRQGRLRIEQARLSKNHNLGARDERRGQERLAEGVDAARVVVHQKEVQVTVLGRHQGLDQLSQGLLDEKLLVAVQEIVRRGLSLRDVLQDALDALFGTGIFLTHRAFPPIGFIRRPQRPPDHEGYTSIPSKTGEEI